MMLSLAVCSRMAARPSFRSSAQNYSGVGATSSVAADPAGGDIKGAGKIKKG